MSGRRPHRATTRNVGGLFPFMAQEGTGERGLIVGQMLTGARFVYDFKELYHAERITSPNMLVLGHVGSAKTSLVKTMLWRANRQLDRRALVLDPKGEYDALANKLGTESIRFPRNGGMTVNPLDPMLDQRAQLSLLRAILNIAMSAPMNEEEMAAVTAAHNQVYNDEARRVPTISSLVEALFSPTHDAAGHLRVTEEQLTQIGRRPALSLRRMISGDLQGMFDGPTSSAIKLDGPIVVFNFHDVEADALPILVTCVSAWQQGAWAGRNSKFKFDYVVTDEAWQLASNIEYARTAQRGRKLARQYGIQNISVMHHLSDMWASGNKDDVQVSLARGMLSDSDTVVIYKQPKDEVRETKEMLGLSDAEADMLPNLKRGWALWKIGSNESYVVRHMLSPLDEPEIVNTDANMAQVIGL